MAIDIGINDKDRARIAESLSKMLADSYILYLKTHNFHWNVTGPMFQTLHILFMQQYTELWNALDLIAERIRSLGHPAPGSYKRYVELSSIQEEEGVPSAHDMIRQLVAGQEAVARTARAAFKVADAADDQAQRRPAHAAHGSAREERLDAALTAGRRRRRRGAQGSETAQGINIPANEKRGHRPRFSRPAEPGRYAGAELRIR